MLPDPTVKLIGWAAKRTTEAIVGRVTDRIAANVKAGLFASVRHHTVVASPIRRLRGAASRVIDGRG